MSSLHVGTRDARVGRAEGDDRRRRGDLDHDVVAVVAMLVILVLTAAAFVVQAGLPL